LEELPEETVRRLAASMIAGKALTVLNVEDPLMQTLADLEGAVGDANLEAVDDLLGEELRRKDNGKLPPPLAALRDNVVQRNEQDNVRGLLVQFKNVRKLVTADMVVYDGKAEQVMPVEFTMEHTADGWRIVDAKLTK